MDSLNGQQFNINGCQSCEFFIFDVTANLYIDNCKDCFIYCAPCVSTVFVRDSSNIRMIVATKQFRIRDCYDCEFSLYCNSQPVIESSDRIVFSNFAAVNYQQLHSQFVKTRMSVFNNHWSEIHDFTKASELHY